MHIKSRGLVSDFSYLKLIAMAFCILELNWTFSKPGNGSSSMGCRSLFLSGYIFISVLKSLSIIFDLFIWFFVKIIYPIDFNSFYLVAFLKWHGMRRFSKSVTKY